MRVIIAGSRTCTDPNILNSAVEDFYFRGHRITTVVCGCARGADHLGRVLAWHNGFPLREFKPDWKKYGRSAGAIRNEEMAKNADALIALWDGKSPGTKHMIEAAKRHGLIVCVWQFTP